MSAFGIAIKAIAWTTPIVSKRRLDEYTVWVAQNVFSPLLCIAGPRNNMQPDTVNFETLASVYGVVWGPAPGAPSSSATEPVNPQTPPPQRERDNENEEDDDGDDRQLRRRVVSDQKVGVAQNDFPPSVQQRMKEVDSVVHGGGSAGRRWRLLHESPHGRALEMDLGEGYRVQLHFLLA